MLCAALVFIALSIFYYEYVPIVQIEQKPNDGKDGTCKSSNWTSDSITSVNDIVCSKTDL